MIIKSLSNRSLSVIDFYKFFYKKYLFDKHQDDIEKIKERLLGIYEKHIENKLSSQLSYNYWQNSIISETSEFLKQNFDEQTKDAYNESYSVGKKQIEKVSNSLLLNFAVLVGNSMSETYEKLEKEWEYKSEFIKLLLDCVVKFGLHESVFLRDKEKYEKFNLLIYHYRNNNRKQKAFRLMMDRREFENNFLTPYKSKSSISVDGMLIPFECIDRVKVYSTLLLEDEIELLAKRENFSWTSKKKNMLAFIESQNDVTDKCLPNPYIDKLEVQLVTNRNNELLEYLSDFSKAKELYEKAIEKIGVQGQERNFLDDLRLSLELLLKGMFNNDKSLENQLANVRKLVGEKEASKEIGNIFHKILDYYTKYQNNNVKHDDKVQQSDILVVLDLTEMFMRYILRRN